MLRNKTIRASPEAYFKAEVTKDNYTTFEGAQGICPDGWHIPTRAEFVALCGNSNKANGESGTLIDKNAAYFDEGYNGAKITALDADGFGWSFSGVMVLASASASSSTLRPSPTPAGNWKRAHSSRAPCLLSI